MGEGDGVVLGFDPELFPLLFETVVDRSGVGVVVLDSELRYLYVNEVAAAINGCPVAEHLGRRLADVIPDVGATLEPALHEVLDHEVPLLNVEVVGETPAAPGRRRYWMANYTPFRSPTRPAQQYLVLVFIETTGQRRSQERLRRIIDGLFTFVGLLDPDGTLLEANEPAVLAGGLRRSEVIGRPFWDTYWWSHSADVQDQLRAAVEAAREGRSSRYDVEVRVAGGRRIIIDFQLVPIVEDGVVAALVPSGVDITDRVATRRRLEALASLARHLNGARSSEAVVALMIRHASEVVDADFVNVALLDRDRRCLDLVQPQIADDIEERWRTLPLDGERTPFHDVVETGRPRYVDRDERARDFPHMVDDTDRVGLDTTASMPLLDRDGEAFGVLGVGWADPVELTRERRARLDLLADLCSQALQRSRTTEAQDDLVHELQDEVLAARDAPHGLDVAVAYRAANHELGFGGDWYDVIAVDGDRSAFVVGDVAGHGTSAAARMTAAKATLRALATAVPEQDVVPQSSVALAHLGSGYVATAALAWIDRGRGELRWCLAGHPPPVLRRPGGETLLLDGAHHGPIGMPTTAVPLSTTDFPVGSQLVLYTDGLVEQRGTDIDDRLEALRAFVAALPDGLDSSAVRDRLLADLGDGYDDIAVVVVQRPA